MAELITQLHHQLNSISPHQTLPQQIIHSFLLLLRSTLASRPVLEPIRTPLLQLIYSLNQRNLQLPVQLTIQLIENYAQLNRSIISSIIENNLKNNPHFITLFGSSICQLVQELTLQPDHPQLANSLSLISQSHPQLLELFYQPSSHHPDIPFVSIVKVIENGTDALVGTHTRARLIFIILKVLKDGIIPRLRRATAAFDATDLVDQLSIIFNSKSKPFLSDLRLNYPNFIEQIDQLIHLSSNQSSYNLSMKHKSQLNSFFSGSKELEIFSIFNNDSPSTLQNQFYSTSDQLSDVIKNRKNIFDDHQMDVKLLSKGKSKLDEREILNDKSHLTDQVKMKMKSRLEAIEMNPDEEDLEIPILFDDNDDDGSDQDDNEEHTRKMKRTVLINIFTDEDHLFSLNKNEEMDNSEGSTSEKEEGGGRQGKGSRNITTARSNNNSFIKNKQTNYKEKHQEEKQSKDDTTDGQKKTQHRGEREGNQRGNGAMRRAGMNTSRGQWRGEVGVRGRGRGRGHEDVEGRGIGSHRGRGGSHQGKASNSYKKLGSSSSTHPQTKPSEEITVEASKSPAKTTAAHCGRGAPGSNRGTRGNLDHQKKSHERRVRGRDRKLAQISGGI